MYPKFRFYILFNYSVKKKLVSSPHENFQNKTIERLFEDSKGNPLRNLKQSKTNSAKGADQELLAEIVRSIN